MFISFVGEAQIFEQGSKFVNLGFGVGAGYSGSGLTTSLPPISASFESGITDKIGGGWYHWLQQFQSIGRNTVPG